MKLFDIIKRISIIALSSVLFGCSTAMEDLRKADIEDKTYPVYFYSNGGKGKNYKQDFTIGVSKKLDPCKFEPKEDMAFDCWSTKKYKTSNGCYNDEDVFTLKDRPNDAYVTLYAIWKKAEE